MYYYIIDPQKLNQRQFERVQNQLYSSLSEYRINGETTRVTALRSADQLVEAAFSHGAKTIVAVGFDETLHEIINSIAGRDMTLGFIPLGDSEIGNILGIKGIEEAAKIIAGRRITLLDLGMVNDFYFLTKLTFGLALESNEKGLFNYRLLKYLFSLPTFEVAFSAVGQYKASLKVLGGMIVNARGNTRTQNLANPTDQVLDILLLPKLSKYNIFKYRKSIISGAFEEIPGSSLLHVEKLEITSPEGLPLKVGERIVAKTPAIIQLLPQKLKIIAGKDRIF
ncbi:MAG TPA: diacylglycerol kinase family protein [Patescibacteria group bacterium]|jgi:diacylglycerol kinase family enzyme|nr:diacylglycerol kinase family protein [Patescibacteria group bacterium]